MPELRQCQTSRSAAAATCASAARPGLTLAEGPPTASPAQPLHVLGGPMPGGAPGTPAALAMGSPAGPLPALHFHPQQPQYMTPTQHAHGALQVLCSRAEALVLPHPATARGPLPPCCP